MMSLERYRNVICLIFQVTSQPHKAINSEIRFHVVVYTKTSKVQYSVFCAFWHIRSHTTLCHSISLLNGFHNVFHASPLHYFLKKLVLRSPPLHRIPATPLSEISALLFTGMRNRKPYPDAAEIKNSARRRTTRCNTFKCASHRNKLGAVVRCRLNRRCRNGFMKSKYPKYRQYQCQCRPYPSK